MKERIFSRDESIHASIRGLFFVREILDLTGITIRETEKPGKGARFEITVPKGMYRFTGTDNFFYRNTLVIIPIPEGIRAAIMMLLRSRTT